ncbi:hypothetical protein GGD63_000107 [Bradyrhizobium sp. cir1]|nr:hypothetical protein [Bradyrhizobium sp. cir1]
MPDEQTQQMVEANEMIDMRMRDKDLVDASDLPWRQGGNLSNIEQQTSLLEQRFDIDRRIAVATVDQARMEKRSHDELFCCNSPNASPLILGDGWIPHQAGPS